MFLVISLSDTGEPGDTRGGNYEIIQAERSPGPP